jgi:beta-glucanase (GH16 family)
MEYRGDRPNQIEATIHYGESDSNFQSSGSPEMKFETDFSADWHTFGIEWNANEFKWFCDGKEYHKENIHRLMYSHPYTKFGQPFDQPFYWILNVAVGGNFFPANVYGSQITPEEAKHWAKPTMEVDYVRVWHWI